MEVRYNTELKEKGLYATKTYLKYEIVFTLSGEEYDKPMRETIYVGNNTHIYDQNGIYMNHSFNPTTYINKYDVVALNNINIDDELTFDYNKNEINMAAPFVVDGIVVSGKQT